MFFPQGLSTEQVDKILGYMNEARKKEEYRNDKLKKKESLRKHETTRLLKQKRIAEYELLLQNIPTTSITAAVGYIYMINNCNLKPENN